MKTTKIVFIGAGSMSFGLSMFKDLFSSKELKGSTISLVDIDENNLNRMYELALKMNKESGAGLVVEHTVDRREVLRGAEFVVNSIAIERCELWKHDFEIPKKYGIRQTLGENGGPGGLFFTMRTLPIIMDIARDIEELCPKAYFLNFSNPESRIILALNRYTKVKSIGLCHGIFMGQEDVSKIMRKNRNDIEVFGAGLNHFQWLLEIRDKKTGKDLYPYFREMEKKYKPEFEPLARNLFKTFGYYPSCSDDHIGEYVPYGWEVGEEGYDFEWDEKQRKEIKIEIAERVSGKKKIDDWLEPSGERAVNVITSILHNKKEFIESGIVYNEHAISNLPYDLAVEIPIMADGSGIHPMHIGKLPDGIAKLLSIQAGVQQLAVDAAVNGSKEIAMQALLIDPVVNSIEAAQKLIKELWGINEKYIRKCI